VLSDGTPQASTPISISHAFNRVLSGAAGFRDFRNKEYYDNAFSIAAYTQ
jgi:hypothetical protein